MKETFAIGGTQRAGSEAALYLHIIFHQHLSLVKLASIDPNDLCSVISLAMPSWLSQTLFGCFSSRFERRENRDCVKTTGDGNKNCSGCIDC